MKNQAFLHRLGFALAGLKTAWRTESSFKTHVCRRRRARGAAVAPAGAAVVGHRGADGRFVLAAEIFNTAVEGLADHLHPEQHPAIKAVKDCAAGAVLVATIAALGVAAAFVYDVVLR